MMDSSICHMLCARCMLVIRKHGILSFNCANNPVVGVITAILQMSKERLSHLPNQQQGQAPGVPHFQARLCRGSPVAVLALALTQEAKLGRPHPSPNLLHAWGRGSAQWFVQDQACRAQGLVFSLQPQQTTLLKTKIKTELDQMSDAYKLCPSPTPCLAVDSCCCLSP